MNHNEWLNEFPANERLVFFIEGELLGDDDNVRFEALSKALGYSRSSALKRLMGNHKIPLRYLSGIAKFLERDIAHLLPLWILQELPDDAVLNLAAAHMLTADDYPLIDIARKIYLGDDED